MKRPTDGEAEAKALEAAAAEAHAATERELQAARRIQGALLPRVPSEDYGLDIAARYESARDVRPFGTSFRTWVDADVAEALDRCWSDLRVDASIRALHATVALFRTTGDRAASAIGLQPFAADAVVEEIARIAKAASP